MCSAAPAALEAGQWLVEGNPASVDFSQCPVDGCAFNLFATLSSGSRYCFTGYDPPIALADGAPCSVSDGGRGACLEGVCVGLAVCGDGVVQAGEECDDTSGCCDLSSCMLANAAQCSGGECCDSSTCRPRSSSTLCASDTGICIGGAR